MNEHQVNNMIKLQLATTLTEASDKLRTLLTQIDKIVTKNGRCQIDTIVLLISHNGIS